jgi:hypothetical protein
LGQFRESKDGRVSLFSVLPGVGARFKFSKFENERRDPGFVTSAGPGTGTISGYPVYCAGLQMPFPLGSREKGGLGVVGRGVRAVQLDVSAQLPSSGAA